MTDRVAALAAAVVARANRERPADAVLREVLGTAPRLRRSEGAEVSRCVFAYYRWLGWLDRSEPVAAQLAAAQALAERFAAEPSAFADAELRERALPAWAQNQVRLSSAGCRALQCEAPLWLRARPGQGSTLAGSLGDCQPAGPGTLSDTLRYRGRLDLFRTPAFQSGQFEIQDLHSQAVGWICGARPGQTWWDACAGEGGKTLHLADLMQNRGLIWATDRADWRLRRLRQRAARARVFNYRVRLWEGGPHLPTRTSFDGVLVDAPCSSTGTWHRNPHARWTTRPDDVQELAALQTRLLAHAARAVKPGGRLVYSVCTLTDAETRGVSRRFGQDCPEFVPVPTPHPFAPGETPTEIWLDLEPEQGNGMFVAVWRRAERPA